MKQRTVLLSALLLFILLLFIFGFVWLTGYKADISQLPASFPKESVAQAYTANPGVEVESTLTEPFDYSKIQFEPGDTADQPAIYF